ncbi:uridine kinase family protein [Faecalimonas sp.]
MGKKMYKIQIGNQIKLYEEGTTYKKIAEEYQKQYENDIVLVIVDGKLQELLKECRQDCKLEFVTTDTKIGNETYRRSMCLLLVKAIEDVARKENVKKIRIQYSVSKGYYCMLDGNVKVTEAFLQQVEKCMIEMVNKKAPIIKKTVHIDDAIATFKQQGMYDKERLFQYRRVSAVNLYEMEGISDYYYGYMVPDASYLKYFALYLYDEGFVLQMPVKEEPKLVPPFKPQKKLFQILKESTQWGDMMHIETVADLNEQITSQGMQKVILVQEAYQERKVAELAMQIAQRPSVKFVLIAGPSSSGKTTFSHRLSIQLQALGLRPHPIAVDNYFVNREFTPKDENGDYDFECLEAIDRELFNYQLTELLEGKEVQIPTFNFKTGQREYIASPTKLGKEDILVIEGIHCLNDALTYKLAAENKFKIYISALTQLNVDEHNRIPTTEGRLLRRMVRDARTRGTSAQNTIAMWHSVRRGEEKNIFPFQEEADAMFNSALIYELAVLKQYAEPILFGIDKECKEYVEAKRLLKFLDYFVGISAENVPKNSLLREFIGGGCFQI